MGYIREFPYIRGMVIRCRIYKLASHAPGMEVTDLDHPDEMKEEYARVCDRVLRVLERLSEGDRPAAVELEEIAADVAMLRNALCSPCPYDFVAKVPTILN